MRLPSPRLHACWRTLCLSLALAAWLPHAAPAEPRAPFTEAEADIAQVSGMPNVRFWADAPAAAFRSFREEQAQQLRQSGLALTGETWLALSGGGERGAFGAGVLNGWTALGTRPEFTVVSGVSTGALIAPFAFLGPRYDATLRALYTDISNADIFRIAPMSALFGPSLTDDAPLRARIARVVDAPLVAEVAREYRRGRRLLVVTTHLDLQRAAIWDMGAIAASGQPGALDLFRDILIASASLPGLFPPVLIDVEANGRKFQELHVDGSLMTQFYTSPGLLLWAGRRGDASLYTLLNIKLDTDFQVAEERMLPIIERSLLTIRKARARDTIGNAYNLAQQNGIDFNLSYITEEFTAPSHGLLIDQDYMQRLYDYGYQKALSPTAWLKRPPAAYETPPAPYETPQAAAER